MNYKEFPRLIKNLQSWSKSVEDTIKVAERLPPIKGGELYTGLKPGELRIDAPYNVEEYKKFRKALGKDWECIDRRFHKTLGSWFFQFSHKKTRVLLDLGLELSETPLEGQNCRLVQVDVVKEPVYKVVCD